MDLINYEKIGYLCVALVTAGIAIAGFIRSGKAKKQTDMLKGEEIHLKGWISLVEQLRHEVADKSKEIFRINTNMDKLRLDHEECLKDKHEQGIQIRSLQREFLQLKLSLDNLKGET